VVHGVADEGVPTRTIAEIIGRKLGLPVAAISPEAAGAHFGWLGRFFAMDQPASSALTRERMAGIRRTEPRRGPRGRPLHRLMAIAVAVWARVQGIDRRLAHPVAAQHPNRPSAASTAVVEQILNETRLNPSGACLEIGHPISYATWLNPACGSDQRGSTPECAHSYKFVFRDVRAERSIGPIDVGVRAFMHGDRQLGRRDDERLHAPGR